MAIPLIDPLILVIMHFYPVFHPPIIKCKAIRPNFAGRGRILAEDAEGERLYLRISLLIHKRIHGFFRQELPLGCFIQKGRIDRIDINIENEAALQLAVFIKCLLISADIQKTTIFSKYRPFKIMLATLQEYYNASIAKIQRLSKDALSAPVFRF